MRNEVIDHYIERLLNDSSPEAPVWNIESIRQGKKPHWNYIDGCMMNSLQTLFERTGDSRYGDFVCGFMDYYVPESGIPLGFSIEEYNLDNINEGRALFDVYAETGNPKYKRAIDLLYRQLQEQPRTKEGNFWHKQIYPNQVWLDGLYMAQVFYTRWANQYGGAEHFDDIARQFANVRKYMYIPEKKLYVHGYDESREVFWADGETGRSKGFWLRAMGWFAVALADVAGYMPDGLHRDVLAAQLAEMMNGLVPYIDSETGMFWQVVDQGGRDGNYLETSGSAMLSYAMLKGARLGILPEEFRERGIRIFNGICSKYLSESENGLELGGICLVAGLGPAGNTRRDGSFEYYVSEPVVKNDAKGVGPFIMCYTEIIDL